MLDLNVLCDPHGVISDPVGILRDPLGIIILSPLQFRVNHIITEFCDKISCLNKTNVKVIIFKVSHKCHTFYLHTCLPTYRKQTDVQIWNIHFKDLFLLFDYRKVSLCTADNVK